MTQVPGREDPKTISGKRSPDLVKEVRLAAIDEVEAMFEEGTQPWFTGQTTLTINWIKGVPQLEPAITTVRRGFRRLRRD